MTRLGVVTGCDSRHEWMLAWWWKKYSATNALPVAFLDFGMTEGARAWCDARGRTIEVREGALAGDSDVAPALAASWEALTDTPIWESRSAWFKKPTGLLRTPFERTLWCDLDTEIRGDVRGALDPVPSASGVALCREPEYSERHAREVGLLPPDAPLYNSGVIAFERGSPVIRAWADACRTSAATHLGDQDVLSEVIRGGAWEIGRLAPTWNWRMGLGENADAVIVHWTGAWGKAEIRRQIEAGAASLGGDALRDR